MESQISAPSTLSLDMNKYRKLDTKQLGHIRHYHNLVSQPDGEWDHFGTTDAHEEFDDARRYQLATMTYAAGLAHYHHLPALRGAFKKLMHKMITKMLRREVWSYWFLSSHGGKVFDPDFTELRKPWMDPVVRENIMYSGHLLLMTSLYAMLFDDDEYEKDGGITFVWDPLFWGLGREEFVYNNSSLAKVILEQMKENEWVGVCCEPNAIFVVCNQFPLVAMRYNDVRQGTNAVEGEILPRYLEALQSKGMFGADGLYSSFYALKQKKAIAPKHGAHTAWYYALANAFMNAWCPDFVRSSYEKQTLGFLTHFDGKTQLQPTPIAFAFRRLVLEEGFDPNKKVTLEEARSQVLGSSGTKTTRTHDTNNAAAAVKELKTPFETLNWLSFTMMLSELGKKKELDDLLEYADARLHPRWERGGLYYPRNQRLMDEEGNLIHIEPHSGNSGIGYARLNVKDGQRTMWQKPWTRDQLSIRPFVDGDAFDEDIDFSRGVWDAEVHCMVLTLKRWIGPARKASVFVQNLQPGSWAIYVDQQLNNVVTLEVAGNICVEQVVGLDEVDIVVKLLQ